MAGSVQRDSAWCRTEANPLANWALRSMPRPRTFSTNKSRRTGFPARDVMRFVSHSSPVHFDACVWLLPGDSHLPGHFRYLCCGPTLNRGPLQRRPMKSSQTAAPWVLSARQLSLTDQHSPFFPRPIRRDFVGTNECGRNLFSCSTGV